MKPKKQKKKLSKQKLTSRWSTKKPLYVEKNDKRYKKYAKQLKKNGFCDTETWNLGYAIVEFALPRLKRFREILAGYPYGDDMNGGEMTQEKWSKILDKMIFAFEWALLTGDNKDVNLPDKVRKENWKKYEEGMRLFSEWILNLWW